MQGKVTNPFAGNGWKVHEKRGGGYALYNKYDNQLKVIVSKVSAGTKNKRPTQIYFSQKAYDELGRPSRVEVREHENGMIAFFPVPAADKQSNGNAYYATFPHEDKEHRSRPSFNMVTVIADNNLRSGVYDAQIFTEGENRALVILSGDVPSQP